MLYLLEEDSIVGVEMLQKCDEVLCTHDQRLLRLFTHKYLHIPVIYPHSFWPERLAVLGLDY